MDYQDKAISAVNEYLISLLQKGEFCLAKHVGEALRILVELKQERPRPERNVDTISLEALERNR